MQFTKEMMEKAKAAQTAEELLELAKTEGAEMTAEEAAKAFARLHKSGELADEELDNVSGGCGDPEPNAQWGSPGVWKNREDVIHDFTVGMRVAVYLSPTNLQKGTVIATDCAKDDYGWYPTYLVHFDDPAQPDEWCGQVGTGKLL